MSRSHRVECWSLYGVYGFFNEPTMSLEQTRDHLGYCDTQEQALQAEIEYNKNPDPKYDYVFVEPDSYLDF